MVGEKNPVDKISPKNTTVDENTHFGKIMTIVIIQLRKKEGDKHKTGESQKNLAVLSTVGILLFFLQKYAFERFEMLQRQREEGMNNLGGHVCKINCTRVVPFRENEIYPVAEIPKELRKIEKLSFRVK